MNIALPAFVLVALLMPGVILRSAYRTIGNTRISHANFWEASFRTITLAALLHASAIWLVGVFTPYEVRLDIVLQLLLGTKAPPPVIISAIVAYPGAVWSYFLGLYASAFFLGKALQYMVRRHRWDRHIEALRFPNIWFYLLSETEDPNLELSMDERKKPDGICVSAVLDFGEPMLYCGFLSDFEVEEDELKRIVLSQASRRLLRSDRNLDEPHVAGAFGNRGYAIEVEHLVIEAKDIKTLGIEYIWFEEELSTIPRINHQGAE